MDPIGFVTDLTNRNMRLREISPVYPEIHREQSENEVTLSTWVPFEHQGETWQRHCVEVGLISKTYTEPQLYARMHGMASLVKKYTRYPYNNPELPIFCDRKVTTNNTQ